MNFLDVRTVLFGQLLSETACALVIVLLWQQNRRRFAGTGYWALDFCFQAAATVLVMLRGSIPNWMSMLLANTLVIIGAVAGYIGLQRFVGKKGPQIHNYLLVGAFVLAHAYFLFVQPNLPARTVALSLGLLILCAQCAWLMLRQVEAGMRPFTRGTGYVFAAFCLVNLFRIIATLVAPNPSNDFFKSGASDALGLLAYQILLILLAYSLALMVNQRLLSDVQAQEGKFATAFRSSPYAITLTRPSDGRIIEVNDGFERLSGYQPAEALGKTTLDLQLWVRDEDRIAVVEALSQRRPVREAEYQFRRKTGELLTGLFSAEIILVNGQPCILSSIADITERKLHEQEKEKLQGQLLQAQKLESVGRLAGGVAHEFNNMLQAILGFADLGLGVTDPASPLREYLEQIRKAASRSANLTRQLLAFARQQMIQPVLLDLNDAISGALKLLRPLVGEDIQLAWMPGANIWSVRMDPAQVDQILANLAANARDAIAGVGSVTIETSNVTLDSAFVQTHPGAEPGDYVLLTVTDTGAGIAKSVLDHIFEPFFTTKELGKGVGLGLATVFGIVKQNNGWIDVDSALGRGTTFKIYLPRCQAATRESAGAPAAEEAPAPGAETLLVVEDEEAILELSLRLFSGLGYTVLTASSPSEALRLATEYAGPIHMLLSDIIMPEMNGRELAERLSALRPGLRCLFMSGYPADVIAHRGMVEEGVRFVEKPFTPNALALAVRSILDEN